jgi:hypothetical protein
MPTPVPRTQLTMGSQETPLGAPELRYLTTASGEEALWCYNRHHKEAPAAASQHDPWSFTQSCVGTSPTKATAVAGEDALRRITLAPSRATSIAGGSTVMPGS